MLEIFGHSWKFDDVDNSHCYVKFEICRDQTWFYIGHFFLKNLNLLAVKMTFVALTSNAEVFVEASFNILQGFYNLGFFLNDQIFLKVGRLAVNFHQLAFF